MCAFMHKHISALFAPQDLMREEVMQAKQDSVDDQAAQLLVGVESQKCWWLVRL